MAKLSEEEKAAFLQFARGPRLPAQAPPILPMADYLRLLAKPKSITPPPQARPLHRITLEAVRKVLRPPTSDLRPPTSDLRPPKLHLHFSFYL